MGFLKKEKAPDELPDLAIDSPKDGAQAPVSQEAPKNVVASIGPPAVSQPQPVAAAPQQPVQPAVAPVQQPTTLQVEPKAQEAVHGENYLEFSEKDHAKTQEADPADTAKPVEEKESPAIDYHEDVTKPKFFDKILTDINGEIQDIGKLGDWYENKFESQDIVSNMKGYWESSKADIIIQSFGAEYKKKINENVKELQKLEEDWRVIYFSLIKKEEEMKKVEQGLKGTLAEFVDLCKRRKDEENAQN